MGAGIVECDATFTKDKALDMYDIVQCPKVIVSMHDSIEEGGCGLVYTDENALINAYSSLVDGSQLHLRAFVGQIEAVIGVGNCEAQYLTQEEVDTFLGPRPGRSMRTVAKPTAMATACSTAGTIAPRAAPRPLPRGLPRMPSEAQRCRRHARLSTRLPRHATRRRDRCARLSEVASRQARRRNVRDNSSRCAAPPSE